jgi:hypothetical protein
MAKVATKIKKVLKKVKAKKIKLPIARVFFRAEFKVK